MRVGYTTKAERRTSRETRIEVITEGILLRRLQRERTLPGIGLVIMDEFHERNMLVGSCVAAQLPPAPMVV
jgi:ATP-dependent helicase HrpB